MEIQWIQYRSKSFTYIIPLISKYEAQTERSADFVLFRVWQILAAVVTVIFARYSGQTRPARRPWIWRSEVLSSLWIQQIRSHRQEEILQSVSATSTLKCVSVTAGSSTAQANDICNNTLLLFSSMKSNHWNTMWDLKKQQQQNDRVVILPPSGCSELWSLVWPKLRLCEGRMLQ